MTERKRPRAKMTPSYMEGSPLAVMIWLSEEAHAAAKIAARQDRRTLQHFCAVAVEEKVARMQESDIEAPGFIPPGLRR